MQIYIGTRKDEKELHNSLRDAAEVAGHEITYDWTAPDAVAKGNPQVLNEIAFLVSQGIEAAEGVVLLLNDGPTGRGIHAELAMAIIMEIPVLLWTPPENASIFDAAERTSAFYWADNVTRLSCPVEEVQQKALGWLYTAESKMLRDGSFELANGMDEAPGGAASWARHPEHLRTLLAPLVEAGVLVHDGDDGSWTIVHLPRREVEACFGCEGERSEGFICDRCGAHADGQGNMGIETYDALVKACDTERMA